MSHAPTGSTDRRDAVIERALEFGFDLAGIAPLAPPPDADRFDRWIDEGRHGSMAYLERGRDVTVDPRTRWPEGRSLLVVGLGHSREAVELAGGGRIARYAAGRDYHNLIGKRLQRLRRSLERDGLAVPGSACVDATPLLERSHAEAAGLGFASKAANLLHPRFGPWTFLGEVILDVELEPTDAQRPHGSCGTCTACIDACPTDAIVAPGEVDARRCISYSTIEHRGLVEHELREANGDWVFGCDVCSEVCPWGSKAPDLAERFGRSDELAAERTLVELFERRDLEHAERFRGSPLRRPGRDGIARNAAIAMAEVADDGARDALSRAVESDASPIVRAAAAWTLAYRYRSDAGVTETLDRVLARDPSDDVRDDLRRSLERAGRDA